MKRSVVLIEIAAAMGAGAIARGDTWLPVHAAKGAVAPRGARLAGTGGPRRAEATVSIDGAWRARVQNAVAAFDRLSVPGCGADAEGEGLPELPFKGFFVEVPEGADVRVRLESAATVSLGTGFRVAPRQAPLPDAPRGPDPPFRVDRAAYAADRWYPREPVAAGNPGFIRGRRVVFVRAFPLRFNPATTELRAHPEMRILVEFDRPLPEGGGGRARRLANPASEGTARGLILNYAPAAPAPAAGPDGGGEGGNGGADYLIVAADHLYDSVLPLADWKRRKGFVTKAVKLSEVGSTSAEVRAYVKNAYDTWDPAPSYLLLVGDHGDIPAGYLDTQYPCHSDHVYACVDGEDYWPDLAVGRIPAGGAAECAGVVDKILAYDRTPAAGGWYDDFVSAGYFQDLYPNDSLADRWFMETSVYVRNFLRDAVGYQTHTAWTTSHFPLQHASYHYRASGYPHRPPYPDPVPADVVGSWTSRAQATADLAAAVNAGAGLVIHRDHGGETEWSDPPFAVGNVNALSNGAKTPVVFGIECLAGSFQRGGGDSFCEAFLKKSPGGCVAIVGATRESYSGYNDLLCHGILACLWPSYDPSYASTAYPASRRPAEALNYGKYYLLSHQGESVVTESEFYMFHYFGDPELTLRTASPRPLDVAHPPAIYYGAPSDLVVSVSTGGEPVAGALVALSRPDIPGDYWRGLTDAGGEIAFAGVSAGMTGDYALVVTAPDCAPHEGTIAAIAASDGMLRLGAATYRCGEAVGLTVSDADLAGEGSHAVLLASSGGDAETCVLAETGTGVFTGTLPTSPGASSPGDGTLQAGHGDAVTASYLDADDGAGGTNVEKTDSAPFDCLAPAISGVAAGGVTGCAFTVSWTTGEPAACVLRYGTDPYDLDSALGPTPVGTSHSLTVDGLAAAERIYFAVEAADGVGNASSDDRGGALYACTTNEFVALYETGFETGPIGQFTPEWTVGAVGQYANILRSTAHGPHAGTHHAVMERALAGAKTVNHFTLRLDAPSLAGNAELRYWFKEFNDEDDPEDGVSISADGAGFLKVRSHAGGPQAWTEQVIDLDAEAAAKGIAVGAPFYIRWSQAGTSPIPSDGIAIDDVTVGGSFPADTDGDGAPDNADDDDDGDGLTDDEEVRDLATDPASADTDGDGLGDYAELSVHGSDPLDADTDGDGLGDGEEVLVHGTLPSAPDTDGDGVGDRIEILCGEAGDALDPSSRPGTIRVNFQPPGGGPPPRHAPDGGAPWSAGAGMGWT